MASAREWEMLWFHSHFEALTTTCHGDAWQAFVTAAMSSQHGGAFIQVDPAGRGDQGCDGYVDGLMFACYGAKSPSDRIVQDKIDSDLNKARTHWGHLMERWAFVYNNAAGLPVMAGKKLADLRRSHLPNLSVENWPPEVLWRECLRELDRDDLVRLLGLRQPQTRPRLPTSHNAFARLRAPAFHPR